MYNEENPIHVLFMSKSSMSLIVHVCLRDDKWFIVRGMLHCNIYEAQPSSIHLYNIIRFEVDVRNIQLYGTFTYESSHERHVHGYNFNGMSH